MNNHDDAVSALKILHSIAPSEYRSTFKDILTRVTLHSVLLNWKKDPGSNTFEADYDGFHIQVECEENGVLCASVNNQEYGFYLNLRGFSSFTHLEKVCMINIEQFLESKNVCKEAYSS